MHSDLPRPDIALGLATRIHQVGRSRRPSCICSISVYIVCVFLLRMILGFCNVFSFTIVFFFFFFLEWKFKLSFTSWLFPFSLYPYNLISSKGSFKINELKSTYKELWSYLILWKNVLFRSMFDLIPFVTIQTHN